MITKLYRVPRVIRADGQLRMIRREATATAISIMTEDLSLVIIRNAMDRISITQPLAQCP